MQRKQNNMLDLVMSEEIQSVGSVWGYTKSSVNVLSLKNNFFVLQMTGVNESLYLIILFSAYIGFLLLTINILYFGYFYL